MSRFAAVRRQPAAPRADPRPRPSPHPRSEEFLLENLCRVRSKSKEGEDLFWMALSAPGMSASGSIIKPRVAAGPRGNFAAPYLVPPGLVDGVVGRPSLSCRLPRLGTVGRPGTISILQHVEAGRPHCLLQSEPLDGKAGPQRGARRGRHGGDDTGSSGAGFTRSADPGPAGATCLDGYRDQPPAESERC